MEEMALRSRFEFLLTMAVDGGLIMEKLESSEKDSWFYSSMVAPRVLLVFIALIDLQIRSMQFDQKVSDLAHPAQ